MRVMVLVKATRSSEAGVLPNEKFLEEMGAFNVQLVQAGIAVSGEGLHPTKSARRLRFSGGKRTVVDGPFTPTKDLVAGYWIWEVASLEEALAWLQRCPEPMPGQDCELELRQILGPEDLEDSFTSELREQEAAMLERMQQQKSGATNTIRLHRVLRAQPERVYRAFVEPEAMVKWLPPHGFTGKVLHSDVRVGGGYRMSFTNHTTGQTHAFGGTYVELTPHERIRYTDRFDDPNLPGVMNVTVTLKPVSCGTELSIVQEGVPAVIPPEMCYLGWQESLIALAQLVEPVIPD